MVKRPARQTFGTSSGLQIAYLAPDAAVYTEIQASSHSTHDAKACYSLDKVCICISIESGKKQQAMTSEKSKEKSKRTKSVHYTLQPRKSSINGCISLLSVIQVCCQAEQNTANNMK
jgi:hypothetical protein